PFRRVSVQTLPVRLVFPVPVLGTSISAYPCRRAGGMKGPEPMTLQSTDRATIFTFSSANSSYIVAPGVMVAVASGNAVSCDVNSSTTVNDGAILSGDSDAIVIGANAGSSAIINEADGVINGQASGIEDLGFLSKI